MVLLAPCAHVLHSQCSSFIHKRAKLVGRTDLSCPLCNQLVHNATPLFLTESWDEGGAEVDDDDNIPQGNAVDPSAMLARVFHYQRRFLMHHRKVIELQLGLEDIQRTLAVHHQRRCNAQVLLGQFPATHLQRLSHADPLASQLDVVSLKELAIQDTQRLVGLREKVAKLKAKNDAAATTVAHLKHLIREHRSRGLRLVKCEVSEPAVRDSDVDLTAPAPVIRGPAYDVVDVDATSSSSEEDVIVVEAPQAVAEEEEDPSLPPLFPVARTRASASMPTVGVSTGRSLRDLPRPEDNTFQHNLDRWSR